MSYTLWRDVYFLDLPPPRLVDPAATLQVTAALLALVDDAATCVVTVNDRFSWPRNGWADCSVYVSFRDTAHRDIVCEVPDCCAEPRGEWT